MDTLSHALWGKGLFGYRKYRWASYLFGAIPDLLSFGVYGVFSFIKNPLNISFGPPDISTIPLWVFSLYDFSHSLIIATFFLLFLFKVNKDIFFPALAWPLHIALDFFTHSLEYFPTPIFWPVSDYRFDGIPWSSPFIIIANIAVIFFIFVYRKNRTLR